MSKNLEKAFFWIIAAGSCFILFIPLFISRSTLYPFIFGKIISFRITVEIIGAVYILFAILFPKYRPRWKNPLVLAVTVFTGILFLSTLFGVDIHRSFWSTQERMTGFWTMLHFWAFFIILVSVFKTWKQWLWLLRISIFASLIVAFYALGQKLNIQKFFFEAGQSRITGTIGNPDFVATYLLFFIFLCLLLFIKFKNWFWRIFYGVIGIFEIVILIFSQTRSVAVGLAVSIFVGLLLLIIFLPQRKLKICFIVILLLLSASISFIWLNKDKAWIKEKRYIGRFTKISFEAGKSRLIAWGIGWRGWKEKFLLGWGPENYNVAFNKYYDPYYLEGGAQSTWFDRAHSIIFDVGTTSGIFGFLSYIAIFVAGFYILWKNRKTIGISSAIILVSLLVAYFVQNIFNFDTPASFIAFFLVLGFIGSLSISDTKDQTQDTRYKVAKLVVAGLTLIILVPILIYQTNVKPLRASRAGVKGIAISAQVDYRKGIKFFKESLDLGTFTNPEIRLQLAKATINAAISGRYRAEDMRVGLKFAIDEMEKNIKEHPKDVRYYLFLGQLYNLMAQYDATYIKRAEGILEEGLELSPQRQQIYFELAQTKIFQKNYDAAILFLEKTVELNPNVEEAHLNLGITYIEAGRDKEGLEEIGKASKLGYRTKDANFFLYLAKANVRLENYKTAIYDYQVATTYDPKNAKAHAELAALYAKVGDKENARERAKKAVELDPRFKSRMEAFLKELEEENED